MPSAMPMTAAPPENWEALSEPLRPFLGDVTRRLRAEVDAFDPAITNFVQYALNNSGKQLRPLLVGLGAGGVKEINKDHATLAIIIEMVHLASLVHDDVMDEARVRRRRPTLAANWGNEIAVLAGDCLFAQALQHAAEFPKPDVCRAVSRATKTVCTGEILQTLQRGNYEITRDEYMKVVRMKTAELFALACGMGAELTKGADRGTALHNYGLALGTAYQVYDDCVDVFGNEPEAGKSLGTDLMTGKPTLPVLAALGELSAGEAQRLRNVVSGWVPSRTEELLELLDQAGSLAECQRVIDELLDEARAAVAMVPLDAGLDGLLALCDCLATQTAGLEDC
jgi:octaprenyl-diphosphate synthase